MDNATLVLFLSILISTSLPLLSQYKFEKIGGYSINKSDDFYLSGHLSLAMDDNRNLYYCFLNQVLKFDSNGRFIKQINPIGRGPGEFETLIDCEVNDEFLVVQTFSQFKLIFYKKDDLSYSHEIKTKSYNSRQCAIHNGAVITLNDDTKNNTDLAAVSEYSFDGENSALHGIMPPYAYLSRTSSGGGISSNTDDIFYYSFTAYPQIWKVNTDSQKSTVYKNSYINFSKLDEGKINGLANNHGSWREYLYSHSRSTGLYFLNNEKLLIQIIDNGNPYKNGAYDESLISRTIDIWDTKLDSVVGTGIKLPENKRIVFVNKNLVYLLSEFNYEDKFEKAEFGVDFPFLEIYELRKD